MQVVWVEQAEMDSGASGMGHARETVRLRSKCILHCSELFVACCPSHVASASHVATQVRACEGEPLPPLVQLMLILPPERGRSHRRTHVGACPGALFVTHVGRVSVA